MQPRDPGSGLLWPRRCALFTPGHTPHVIAIKVCLRKEPRRGHLLYVEGNVVAIDFQDYVEQFRNHEPERLLDIVGLDGPVRVFGSILQGRTNYCWSIAQAEKQWEPCNSEPLTVTTPEALAERLGTHGGFLVSGADIQESWRRR